MKKSIVLMLLLSIGTAVFAQKKGAKKITPKKSTTVVKKAQIFNQITIGKLIWMKDNLNVNKFRNGDPIKEAKTAEEWVYANENKLPAFCYYDNEPDKKNGPFYGKLYNWYAINDSRGLAPEGWHVASDNEWNQTVNHLGGANRSVRGVLQTGWNVYTYFMDAGYKMKSKTGWNYYWSNVLCENCRNWSGAFRKKTYCQVCDDTRSVEKKIYGNGDNSSGFSALPGGFRQGNGEFLNFSSEGNWWTSTISSEADLAVYHSLFYKYKDYDDLYSSGYVYKDSADKGCGFSVRCVKNYLSTVKKVVEPELPQVDKKIATIPTFILDNVLDSTAFTDANLDKTKKTIFIYFGPDCGHCIYFVKKMMDSIQLFSNTQIVMMSSVEHQKIKSFYYEHKMNDIPFITMGRDPKYAFVSLFDIRQFPSAYLYDEKGKFVKSFSSEVAIADLINY